MPQCLQICRGKLCFPLSSLRCSLASHQDHEVVIAYCTSKRSTRICTKFLKMLKTKIFWPLCAYDRMVSAGAKHPFPFIAEENAEIYIDHNYNFKAQKPTELHSIMTSFPHFFPPALDLSLQMYKTSTVPWILWFEGFPSVAHLQGSCLNINSYWAAWVDLLFTLAQCKH